MALRFISVILAFCMLAACDGAEKDVVENQHKAIQNYLKGTEYTYVEGVYRYVANASRTLQGDEPVAEPGDSIYYKFTQYAFGTKGDTLMTYTNKEYIIKRDTIINTQFWPLDPIGVQLGATPMLRGMALGLPYCTQGDSLVLILTSEVAYGNKSAGLIPANSAVMMVLDIETVKKL